MLAATLSAIGHVPVGGLALIIGIDRFMSEARAITDAIGNGVDAIVVARWTGDLDRATLEQRLVEGPVALPETAEDEQSVYNAEGRGVPHA